MACPGEVGLMTSLPPLLQARSDFLKINQTHLPSGPSEAYLKSLVTLLDALFREDGLSRGNWSDDIFATTTIGQI